MLPWKKNIDFSLDIPLTKPSWAEGSNWAYSASTGREGEKG